MDKYRVKLYAHAYRDLEEIYRYIAESLAAPNTAERLIDELEGAIFSLEELPYRGAVRRTGRYSGCGYRQLFIKHYVLLYRVLEEEKEVHILTVRYSASQF